MSCCLPYSTHPKTRNGGKGESEGEECMECKASGKRRCGRCFEQCLTCCWHAAAAGVAVVVVAAFELLVVVAAAVAAVAAAAAVSVDSGR